MVLKEIVRPELDYYKGKKKGENCPNCNVPTCYDQIACPDGKRGCCVLHYGWVCPKCNRNFTKE